MKIILFGLTLSSSWGNGHATPYRALLRALARSGHEISFYEKDAPYYAQRRDLERCDYCNLVVYSDWDAVRTAALAEASAADVVLCASYCPEGTRIADDVLALAHPLRVFYDLDTPITLAALEAGGAEYLRADQIPAFDLYLSFTGGPILAELENRWHARRALPLYGCVDPDVHARSASRAELQCDMSYMGTYSADRDRRFVLAGSLYPWEWTWPANVQRAEHLAPRDHPALYSSSRATLNLTRAGMARWGWCPSGRFFEAAACGTPIVSDWFDGLDDFFCPDEEIAIVREPDDVMAVLARGDSDLAAMAARAHQRTLDEHTGDVRARQFVEACEAARRTIAELPKSRSAEFEIRQFSTSAVPQS